MFGNQLHVHCITLMLNYPDKDTESKLVSLVYSIIQIKKENKDTSELESDIDRIVYELYNLNDKEIKIIEE